MKSLLDEYIRQTHRSLDLILIGGPALQGYGVHDRGTVEVDGELAGELEPLLEFSLFPSGAGRSWRKHFRLVSGGDASGYRDRTSVWHEDGILRIRLLHPVDFVIAKLRPGTEQDLDDAQEVAARFHVTPSEIQTAANSAVDASPKDSALFTFRKTVDIFCRRIGGA